MKKKLALLLSIIILSISLCGYHIQPVQASAPNTIMNFLKAALIEKGKAVSGDCIFDFFNWMYDLYQSSEQELCEFMSEDNLNQFLTLLPDALGLDGKVITQEDMDSYVAKKEFLDAIDSLFENYLQERPEDADVVWIPVINETQLKASWFYTTTDYSLTRSLFDSHDLLLLYRPSSVNVGSPIWYDASDFVFCMNGTSFTDTQINAVSYLTSTFGTDTITGSTFKNIQILYPNGSIHNLGYPTHHNGTEWTTYNGSSSMSNIKLALNPFFSGQYDSNGGWDRYYFVIASETSNIKYIPIFAGANAYKNWITGQADYYRFDSGYQGGDITINPNVDYSQITSAVQDAMMQSSANGDSIEAMLAQMQAAFTKALAEISGTLGDIDDNTAVSNSWLEQIYDKLCDLYDMIELYYHKEEDLPNDN